MRLRLIALSLLGAAIGCTPTTTTVTPDAGEISARCVSATNTAAIEAGLGFACGRGRWCDRVDGICKTGECGYDEDCEEGFACDLESNTCRPPCDLGGGIGCECTVDEECPALSFCWGGNCLHGGTRECTRDDGNNLNHSDCTADPSRAGEPVQVIQCTPLDMGVDCVTDSDCAGSTCNQENRRCESLACMRPTCARDGDCTVGQRCHPTANVCVEDLGCRYANYFPQLACGEGQECDVDANQCRDIVVGECTEANEAQTCREREICHVPVGSIDGRCVQCISDFECTTDARNEPCQSQADCAEGTICVSDRNGVSTCRYSTGTHCNLALGQCIGASGCERDVDCMNPLPEPVSCNSDLECPPETYCENIGTNDEPERTCLAPSGRRCAARTNECVLPLCNLDEDCQQQYGGDTRWRCDSNMWRCTLPEPRCEGDGADEPNNAVSSATPLEPFQEEGTPVYYTSTQILCRDDLDVYSLIVEDGQSVDATLALDEAAFARVIDEELECTRESHCQVLQNDAFCLNNRCHAAVPPSAPFYLEVIAPRTGEVVAETRLRDGNWSGTASATALNGGTYFFRIRTRANDADIFPYSLRVNTSTPPPCEIDEPNDNRGEATGLAVGEYDVEMRRFLCAEDVDTYAFRVPSGHSAEVSLAAEAAMSIRLLAATGQEILAQSDDEAEIRSLEWINEDDSAKNVYLTVTPSPNTQLPEEANRYQLRVAVNPPFSCRGTRDVSGDRDTAPMITFGGDGAGVVDDGAMCEAGDVDLYRVELQPGQRVNVRLNNSPRFPLDLRMLDDNGIVHFGEGPVGFRSSYAVNSGDQPIFVYPSISWNEGATEEQRNTDVPFSLSLSLEQGQQCPDPQGEGEPNEGRDSATSLSPSAEAVTFHLCGPNDTDWYVLNLQAEAAVDIEASFTHAEGDVDLYLFNPQGRAIAVGATMDDNEAISLDRTDGGLHYLLVERFAGGDAVQSYSLRSDFSEAAP